MLCVQLGGGGFQTILVDKYILVLVIARTILLTKLTSNLPNQVDYYNNKNWE